MKTKLILEFGWSLQAFRVGWKHSTLHTTSMCIMTMNCRHSGVINVESNLSSWIQSYARVKLAMFCIFFYQTLLGEISGETSKVTRICEGRDLRHLFAVFSSIDRAINGFVLILNSTVIKEIKHSNFRIYNKLCLFFK